MSRPELDVDLFDDGAIENPYPLYRAIRDCGPAVRLPAHDVWAIGRFADVRAALKADDALVSGHGVGLNNLVNDQPARVTLTTDGDVHKKLRTVLVSPLRPMALREITDEVQSLADGLVDDLCGRDCFDGIADFARYLPISVVSHLVGLPEEGRHRMLDWAAAIFNVLGPLNRRALDSVAAVLEMTRYAAGVERSALRQGSWAARLFQAVDEGRADAADVPGMMIDYLAPSLDTTIFGSGSMLWLLGMHPEQWERLRADPSLIPSAVEESLRLESPVRAFSRVAARDYDVEGTIIPKNQRVLVMYGSANRDERRFVEAERFDVGRDASDQLGFGYGVHLCAGAHLARLEMQSLLRAMVTRVRHIEVGDAVVAHSNILRGYSSLRASFR
jgi:cytochrome P450